MPLLFPRDCSQSQVQAQLQQHLLATAACHRQCHSESGGSGLGHFLPWRLLEELATGSTLGAERVDAIREGAASGGVYLSH